MTFRQQISLALAAPLTLTLVVILALLTSTPAPTVTVPVIAELQFDAERARALAAELEAVAPVRAVGSPGSARARAWLTQKFNELGLKADSFAFEVTVASQRRTGEQMWATLPGAGDRALLISAHYDTPEDGSRSNAAGVAILLELARIFSGATPAQTVILMASDSREYGRSWGMKSWLEQSPLRSRLAAALTLDVGEQGDGVRVSGVGLHFGVAPPALQQTAHAAVEQAGGWPLVAEGAAVFLARALPFEMTEHGMLLRAGVPAVGLSAAPESLAVLGRAAEAWLRAMQPQPPTPAGAPFDWPLSRTLMLPTPAVLGLGLLFFAPLFLATGFSLAAQRLRRQELMPEVLALGGVALPLLNGLAVLWVFVLIGWLPRYEWFPGTPGDAFLRQPADWALVPALVFAVFSALMNIVSRRRLSDRLDMPARRATLLLVLSALALTAWAINPFAAVFWLGPAAYLWPWVTPRPHRGGRTLNVALALGGFLPMLGVAVALSLTPAFRVWSWFLLMGAIYGLFPLPVTLAVIAFIACGVRFLRHGLRPALSDA
ncbi:MAG: M28 family peptidase [Anaerolineales bacterium]|nr:M28 family peptidase [Anaerolineales bacterium]